jgi:glycerate-2-kinase
MSSGDRDRFVRNSARLLGHGDRAGRRVVLDILEDTLEALRPARLIDDTVSLEGDDLSIDGTDYDLDGFESRYLLAAGKGATAFARPLSESLEDRLTDGIAVDKRDQTSEIAGVDVLEADHPIPSTESERAGEAVLSMADTAGTDDLVLVVVTGGASALLSTPPPGVTVAEQATVTETLLRAGAPIEDINAVRKHVSRIKGGRLTERLRPATVVTLVVIDEVAGEPWGPTVPDRTTPSDAIAALKRHGCWNEAPRAVREHLRDGDRRGTPASFHEPAAVAVLADGADACDAAKESARSRGLEAAILSTSIEGESRTVGRTISSIAAEIAEAGRPFEPPCVLVSGGETTVTVPDDAGTGGPNQEFALACADRIDGLAVTVVAVDTDGTDGPTERAGGIVDGDTARRAADAGVDIDAALRAHDTTTALAEIGDDVYTRPGTNVNDLRLVYVADRSE